MSKSDKEPKFDPMTAWRDWFVQNERAWSEVMTNYMMNDKVSQSLGKSINESVMGQQMMTQGMAGPMAMMNMPSRDDIVALGERIGQLEDAVARIEAAMTRMADATGKMPARTRKPPQGAGGSE